MMDEQQIQTTIISGLGLPSNNWLGNLAPRNSDVLTAIKLFPDRLLGLGVIRLGESRSVDVLRLRESGFVGLKTTRPAANYDDPRFDEVYAAAVDNEMPILFHTGFIVGVVNDRDDDVSSARCRPVYLDRVARTFPNLTIIMAHLGMPWFDEAAQMCRFHSNVYADLSGSNAGWRSRKSPEFFNELFYWETAWSKILFGSDVHFREIPAAISDYHRILEPQGQAVIEAVFGGTAAKLFKLTKDD